MNASFDHLKNILQYPAQAAAAQATINAKRMADVEKAARSRPHFLPIAHDLPAAIQTTPIPEATEALRHDVIVFGAITDGENRNIRFYRDVESRAIVRYGKEQNLKLSLDAIAGHSAASIGKGGLQGIFRWPEPMLLRSDQFLTIDMYQETAVADLVSTVFCGERVFSAAAEEGQLSAALRADVQRCINLRPAPEPRYSIAPVTFDADGFATSETPKADEPLLCLGFRSTFTDATVNLGFDSDNSFAKSKFPIWALAAEPNNGRGIYQMLKSPLLIASNQKLLFSFKNVIDTSIIAPVYATDGNLEVLLRTV